MATQKASSRYFLARKPTVFWVCTLSILSLETSSVKHVWESNTVLLPKISRACAWLTLRFPKWSKELHKKLLSARPSAVETRGLYVFSVGAAIRACLSIEPLLESLAFFVVDVAT